MFEINLTRFLQGSALHFFWSIIERRGIHKEDIMIHRTAIHRFSRIKDVGLIREITSNYETTFYTCTRPLPEGALSCNLAAADCIVYKTMGGVPGDNSIVCDFPF